MGKQYHVAAQGFEQMIALKSAALGMKRLVSVTALLSLVGKLGRVAGQFAPEESLGWSGVI